LLICDKQSRWKLYRDLGRSTTYVEYPYWPEGERRLCREILIPIAFIWSGQALAGYGVYESGDREEKKPFCP